MDVRLPIGGLLTVVGFLITGFGLATNADSQLYVKSLGVNVNEWWGTFMFLFGLAMLWLARRK
jgi:hypothetical protein